MSADMRRWRPACRWYSALDTKELINRAIEQTTERLLNEELIRLEKSHREVLKALERR